MYIVNMVGYKISGSCRSVGHRLSCGPQDPGAVRINPNKVIREDSPENRSVTGRDRLHPLGLTLRDVILRCGLREGAASGSCARGEQDSQYRETPAHLTVHTAQTHEALASEAMSAESADGPSRHRATKVSSAATDR